MACDDRPVCISAFYLRICGGGGEYSYYVLVIFFTLPRFSYMVSELDYSLLKHVVISDDL